MLMIFQTNFPYVNAYRQNQSINNELIKYTLLNFNDKFRDSSEVAASTACANVDNMY